MIATVVEKLKRKAPEARDSEELDCPAEAEDMDKVLEKLELIAAKQDSTASGVQLANSKIDNMQTTLNEH